MANVVGHTPSWLSAPSPGFTLFQRAQDAKPRTTPFDKADYYGPVRSIAHRNTEIFVLVDNDIRWSDLSTLKHAPENSDQPSYRVLKTPVAGQIRQLVVSPQGDYLAILTSHTVHIAVLPDPSHLSVQDASPLRIKTFQLGPTAHVLEQPPIVSALWHPLGHMGSCLVTVTRDACVRLWELNRDSRASFDEPALALDLKKLGNATSSDQDLRASKYGTSKGFSPDSVDMEVAAACFGARGSSDEHGWAPMTLWVAMTQGDVFALCPLLPSKWEPTATTIPSLTTAVMAKADAFSPPDATAAERRILDHQQRWLADIDAQDPLVFSEVDTMDEIHVYSRPANPPAIPKLQGPFYLSPDTDLDEITDIFVIAPRVDDEALMQHEENKDFLGHYGLSVGVVCLATTAGQVHVCVDLDGIEAQWLPSRRAGFRSRFDDQEPSSELLVVETISTLDKDSVWPTFTPTEASRYDFLLSTNEGVFNISLEPWISPLEQELMDPTDTGAAFRLDVLFDVEKSAVDCILKRNRAEAAQTSIAPTCISIMDPDLRHFILTASSSQPQAVILDLPTDSSMYASFAPDDAPLALPAPAVRQPYQPSDAFFAQSGLPGLLDSAVQQNANLRRSDLKNQVLFSPATLQILTSAHRQLSLETSRLGAAAADLFRRCERMRAELTEQIRQVDEISNRAEAITGDDERGQGAEEARPVGKDKIEERMQTARDRSVELAKRVEAVRRRMAGLGGKELSAKEESWAAEVTALSTSLGATEDETPEAPLDREGLTSRLQAVSQLQRSLVARAKEAADQQPKPQEDSSESDDLSASTSRIPADFRKQKISQVMQLLERETALVDAVADRLGRLRGIGVSTPVL